MNRGGQTLFFLPALALFLTFVLLPAVQTVVDSLFLHQPGDRQFVGLLYYEHALVDPQFHRALRNNLVYMVLTLLFEVGVGLFLAVNLQRQGKMNALLRIAFFSPVVLSMVVIGLVFGFFFKEGIGLLPGWLNQDRALLTISLVSGWAYCGFYMVIFLAGLTAIPGEVLEAARLDGAGPWRTFFQIKLPLLKPVLWVALLICFTGAFKAFDLFWVLLPHQEHTQIVSTLLVREVIQFDNKGYGSTLAVLLTLIVFLITGLILLWQRLGQRTNPPSPSSLS